MVTRIKVALPSAFPYQTSFATLAGRIAQLAVNNGAGCPRTNPAAQPQTLISSVSDATENNAPTSGLAQLSPTPMNVG